MSPAEIVDSAVKAGLDAIAVCDHNATQQAHAVRLAGERKGLKVFYGAELTSREEVHCVAILPDREAAERLQGWIDAHIIKVPNVPEKFGDQVWVDSEENIEGEIEWYLNSAIDKSVEEIADKVHELGGLFIPAHIDRQANSIIGQLGFVSPMLPVDALEYNFPDKLLALKSGGHKYLDKHTCYTASDAHFPHLIGTNPSWLYAEEPTFDELRRALAGEKGRKLVSKSVEC